MIIDGKKIADDIVQSIKMEVAEIKTRKPSLVVVLVGEDPASKIYVNRKTKTCEKAGILSRKIELDATITEAKLLEMISSLNDDPSIDGILVQLPLPSHIDPEKVILAISPDKDVDGLHPLNFGKLLLGQSQGFIPCTSLGILELLKRSAIEIAGKHVVIVGRSPIVGKPTAALLLNNDATVTIVHRKSDEIVPSTRLADILIVATGKPKFITKDMVLPKAAVIDVGINRIDGKIIGDADFDALNGYCRAITPVPGGVGPMTIAMLLANTLKAFRLHQ